MLYFYYSPVYNSMGLNPEKKETERYKGIKTKLKYLLVTVTTPFSFNA